jgi:hypothetical protein
MKITSAKGKTIDFGEVMKESGNIVAVGNAQMNARGDILSSGGIVVKTAEQHSDEFHRTTSQTVTRSMPLSALEEEMLTPAQAVALAKIDLPNRKRKTVDSED